MDAWHWATASVTSASVCRFRKLWNWPAKELPTPSSTEPEERTATGDPSVCSAAARSAAFWPASLSRAQRFAAGLLAIVIWPFASFQYLQADNVAIAIGLLANRTTMLNEKRLDLQHQIESATAIIKSYQDRAAKQTMPVDDAKRAALEALRQNLLAILADAGVRPGQTPASAPQPAKEPAKGGKKK